MARDTMVITSRAIGAKNNKAARPMEIEPLKVSSITLDPTTEEITYITLSFNDYRRITYIDMSVEQAKALIADLSAGVVKGQDD